MFSIGLQKKYYQELNNLQNIAVNVSETKTENKFKTFLDRNILDGLILHSAVLLYTLTRYNNIHSFSLSSNLCECFFGRVKSQCLTGINEINFRRGAKNEIVRKLMA